MPPLNFKRISFVIACLMAVFVSGAAAAGASWVNGERVPTRAEAPSAPDPTAAPIPLNDGPAAGEPAAPTIPALEVDVAGLVNGGSVASGSVEPSDAAGEASAPRRLNGGTVASSDAVPHGADPAGKNPNTLD
jgi:hypothetical protein